MKYSSQQQGFTLIELMVSLSLFVIVVLAAVSSLYTVNASARRVESMRTVLDNLNFSLESMSRTIRTGDTIVCGGTENSSGSNNCILGVDKGSERLSVNSTLGRNEAIEYRWVLNDEGRGRIEKRIQDQGGVWPDTWVSITAPEIDVQKFAFYVDGANSVAAGDTHQPNVIIFAQGVATTAEDTAPFAVQTYISQRAAKQ
jgi:prepilin-type N-terminal cleavage/methylation domain-containing protein